MGDPSGNTTVALTKSASSGGKNTNFIHPPARRPMVKINIPTEDANVTL